MDNKKRDELIEKLDNNDWHLRIKGDFLDVYYYNPDSDCGGQIVHVDIGTERFKYLKDRNWDGDEEFIDSSFDEAFCEPSRQYLIDIVDDDFREAAEEVLSYPSYPDDTSLYRAIMEYITIQDLKSKVNEGDYYVSINTDSNNVSVFYLNPEHCDQDGNKDYQIYEQTFGFEDIHNIICCEDYNYGGIFYAICESSKSILKIYDESHTDGFTFHILLNAMANKLILCDEEGLEHCIVCETINSLLNKVKQFE